MRLTSPLILSGCLALAGCATADFAPPQDDADYIAKTNALIAPPEEFEAVFRVALEDPDFRAAAKKIAEAKQAGVAVQKARLLQNVQPVYPAWKRTTRTEFRTFASLLVDTNGRVVKTKLVPMKGWDPDPEFQDAIETATKQWRYAPATIGGENAASIVTMPMIFSLYGRPPR